MQMVLNDYSIDNQFDTFESFEDYYKNTLQHVLAIIVERSMTLHKLESVIYKPLIEGKPLSIVFQRANQTVLTQMKIYLRKLLAAPFLDDEVITDDGTVYKCPFSTDIPNCFTEAIERKCPILSFQHQDFCAKQIPCKRNETDLVLSNILDKEDILRNMLFHEPAEIRYVLEKYPFSKKVELAIINGRCYAEEALLSLETQDLSAITVHINDLIRDISSGKKTRFWDSIIEHNMKFYEYRLSISSGREFRLFFLWKEKLVFLNGFIKKTQETPRREKEKAMRIIRELGF